MSEKGATNAPLKVRKCVVPPDYFRSEISSRALATSKSLEKYENKKIFELNV